MTAVRSLCYHVLFVTWTLLVCLIYLPLLLGPRLWMQCGARLWLDGALFLQRTVLGLSYECRGLENLPKGPVLIAAKHQSAWDTMIFHRLLSDPAFILKKELLRLPFIGWYLSKSGQIPIDRAAGMKALKQMTEESVQAIRDSRQIVIFPEGHRQPPGRTGDYHSGVAMLRSALNAPVIPVALNSGLFWGRNAFLRYPGIITIAFLEPIPADLDRKSFMTTLKDRIEPATRALENEALARFPSLSSMQE